MRLDAMLVDQPADHLSRAVSAVAHEFGRIEVEALHRTFDHAFGGEELGLSDRRGCFDIDDDRVLGVDQIVGRVAEEGLPAMGAGPTRRRVGGRYELRGDLGCCSERGIIEDSQILIDRSAGSLRWKSPVAFDPLLSIGIGFDQARVNGKSFTADQPFLNTAAQDALEHSTEEIALPEAAMPVLGERRVIRHRPIQTEPAEPPVGQIEMDLLAQAPLRSDAEAVSDQEYPDHQLGIDRWPTDATVEGRQVPPDLFKVHKPIN